MPGIGIPELLIVLVIVLVIFGASRVTDIMGALGKGVAEFRKGTQAVEETKKEDTKVEPNNETPKSA
ncbi:twin-arginine translocase TatA/TatE family subunit [Anaerolineae bacterium CFX7]|nr:twin-arginine translocase TatA/TatE family subunit [Anaerolineae bacterium CFX7]RIK27201.1 MAG: twin-arginine translocase TatA/TatE family subunit [Chloroflexota bacterium]